MGEKKNKAGGSNDKDSEKKKDAGKGDGKKKEGMVVVLKMDMHCEGCAKKILKYAKSIDGVEKAKVEWESNKLTVLGDVDPLEIREDLQEKTKKKVELISPQLPAKDKKEKAEEGGGKKGGGDGGGGGGKNSQEKKGDEQKKPKEIPVVTAVYKVELHCSGCVEKIQRIVSKTKGVEKVAFDRDKDLVTVTGRFDAGELAGVLSERMKRSVQLVPPKKSDKDDSKAGDGGGGGEKKKDEKKGSSKVMEEEEEDYDDDDEDYDDYDDEEEEADYRYSGYGGGGGFAEGRRAAYGGAGPVGYCGAGPAGYGGYPPPPTHLPPPAHYGLLYGQSLHAPQMFSDENPNSCSIM